MKNKIMIDVDSERTPVVVFGKTDDSLVSISTTEIEKLIEIDILCICEALYSLIKVSSENGYCDKNQMVDRCISTMNSLKTIEDTTVMK